MKTSSKKSRFARFEFLERRELLSVTTRERLRHSDVQSGRDRLTSEDAALYGKAIPANVSGSESKQLNTKQRETPDVVSGAMSGGEPERTPVSREAVTRESNHDGYSPGRRLRKPVAVDSPAIPEFQRIDYGFDSSSMVFRVETFGYPSSVALMPVEGYSWRVSTRPVISSTVTTIRITSPSSDIQTGQGNNVPASIASSQVEPTISERPTNAAFGSEPVTTYNVPRPLDATTFGTGGREGGVDLRLVGPRFIEPTDDEHGVLASLGFSQASASEASDGLLTSSGADAFVVLAGENDNRQAQFGSDVPGTLHRESPGYSIVGGEDERGEVDERTSQLLEAIERLKELGDESYSFLKELSEREVAAASHDMDAPPADGAPANGMPVAAGMDVADNESFWSEGGAIELMAGGTVHVDSAAISDMVWQDFPVRMNATLEVSRIFEFAVAAVHSPVRVVDAIELADVGLELPGAASVDVDEPFSTDARWGVSELLFLVPAAVLAGILFMDFEIGRHSHRRRRDAVRPDGA